MSFRLGLLIAVLLLTAPWPESPRAASSVSMTAESECVDAGRVIVQWYVLADPADTTGTSSWYGFDVYRRDMASCGPWVRATTSAVPRILGQVSTVYTIYDSPPADHAWDYQVQFVDVAGTEVQPFRDCYCQPDAYAACPWQSTAVTEGTLVSTQQGPGGVWVHPCADSCYPIVGLDLPLPDDLAPLVNTGRVVRLYQAVSCGIEGCLMSPGRWSLGACGAVPVQSTSWGLLKSTYR